MAQTAVVRARIDVDVKQKAEEILEEIGISSSQAINMFFRRVVQKRGIPFMLTLEASDEVAKRVQNIEAGANSEHYKNSSELFADLGI